MKIKLAEKGICFICNQYRPLIKHHICYKPEKTILICKSCHAKAHQQVTQFHPSDYINKKNEKIILKDRGLAIPERKKVDIIEWVLKKYNALPLFEYGCLLKGFIEIKRKITNDIIVEMLLGIQKKFGGVFYENSTR